MSYKRLFSHVFTELGVLVEVIRRDTLKPTLTALHEKGSVVLCLAVNHQCPLQLRGEGTEGALKGFRVAVAGSRVAVEELLG